MKTVKEPCKADAEWCVLAKQSKHSSARRTVCDYHLAEAVREVMRKSVTGYCEVVGLVKGIPCEGRIS